LPLVVVIVVLGHPFFDILIAIFAAAMGWEWVRICTGGNTADGRADKMPVAIDWIGAAFPSACVLVLGLSGFGVVAGWWLLGLGCAAAVGIGWFRGLQIAVWFGAGMIYVSLPAVSLLLLRAQPEVGTAIVLWVLGLTVAADTLAYVAGRTIGGPKLAPTISPNKTWAGLGGAVLGAGLAGLTVTIWLDLAGLWKLTILSGLLGFVEQGGDLVESAFKRHFGVKDSSQIIPGHGGVLDRVDGLIAVALVVAAISLSGELSFLHEN